MPGGFKSDLNFTVVAGTNFGIKFLKAFDVVGNRKRFVKYRAFECPDKTFVFFFCNVDSD